MPRFNPSTGSLAFWLVLVPILALRAWAQDAPVAAPTAAPTAEELASWTKQLGDEAFEKRSQAEASLRKAGEPARAELEKAVQSGEMEVKTRATRLLAVLKTEPLLKKMEAAVTASKNMEGDMEMVMKMMGMVIVLKVHFKGTADGKRFSMAGHTAVGGQAIPTRAISDGTTLWSEATLPGADKKMVQKFSMATIEKLGGGSNQNPIQGVKDLRANYDFTDLKEGTLDGAEVHILEGKMREGIVERQLKVTEEIAGPLAVQMAKAQFESMKLARVYIRKKDMLVLKSEVVDAKDEVVVSMHLSNIQVDAKLDEAEFKYTPPDGVEVMDMEEAFKAARSTGAGGAAPAE